MFTYQLPEIDQAAQYVLSQLKEKRIIAFYGTMGAGKTSLIKAICKQLGVSATVSSPTFALVNHYIGTIEHTIYHFDFYRIERLEEAYDMGYEEYFNDKALCLIEWPEKIEELLNSDVLKLTLTVNENDSRSILLY